MEFQYSSGDVVRYYDGGSQTGYKHLSAGIYTLTIRENIAVNPYDENSILLFKRI